MNLTTHRQYSKRLASLFLFGMGLAFVLGCQSKTVPETSQNEPAPRPKTAAPKKTEPPTETEKIEKPAAKTVVQREPELPPEPPSTQELAEAELKKRGGKAVKNRNGDVIEVAWQGPEVRDNDLVILQKFPYLRKLDLTETSITDEGLKHLKSLEYLRYLYLLGTTVSDAGIPELQGHSRLEQLCLDGTQVTDEGVKALEPLDRLVMLHLATEGEITDACISTLVKFPDLHEIKLEGTKVTDDGKARLVKARPDIQFIGAGEEGLPPME
jgi:hypothetical protein